MSGTEVPTASTSTPMTTALIPTMQAAPVANSTYEHGVAIAGGAVVAVGGMDSKTMHMPRRSRRYE